MKLKEKIQSDFIVAMKTKNQVAKTALSGLKAKITEAEKSNGNQELSEEGVLKVISNSIKQRKLSYVEFVKGNRLDLAQNENNEIVVLEQYMPTQMTEEEIKTSVQKILSSFEGESNVNKKVGQTMGQFNKSFPGLADPKKVKEIIESLI